MIKLDRNNNNIKIAYSQLKALLKCGGISLGFASLLLVSVVSGDVSSKLDIPSFVFWEWFSAAGTSCPSSSSIDTSYNLLRRGKILISGEPFPVSQRERNWSKYERIGVIYGYRRNYYLGDIFRSYSNFKYYWFYSIRLCVFACFVCNRKAD